MARKQDNPNDPNQMIEGIRKDRRDELIGMTIEKLLDELFVQQNSIRITQKQKKMDDDLIKYTEEIKRHKEEHDLRAKINELRAQANELEKEIKQEKIDIYELKKEQAKIFNDDIKAFKAEVNFILKTVYERKELLNSKKK